MLSPNPNTDVRVCVCVLHSQLKEHMLPLGEKMGNPEVQTSAITVSFSPSQAASLKNVPYVV